MPSQVAAAETDTWYKLVGAADPEPHNPQTALVHILTPGPAAVPHTLLLLNNLPQTSLNKGKKKVIKKSFQRILPIYVFNSEALPTPAQVSKLGFRFSIHFTTFSYAF